MLEVIDLDFDYQDEPILSKVSFSVSAGELLHLRGANGAGKTTLLKIIAGLHQPEKGQIRFFGHSILDDLATYQKQLCLVGHKAGINPQLTIRENCYFDVQYLQCKQNIESLVSVFQLDYFIDKPCGLLSAGQKRQVALLRLWMTKAKIWLLDEPLVALDEAALHLLMEHISAHRAQGGMVILTSHQRLPLGSDEPQEYFL